MSRRRRIVCVAALALLIGLPVGWYYASPWWTLWRIRQAARAGDLATLQTYVDFPRIAATEKAQAKRLWSSVLETPLRDSENTRRFVALARRKLADIARGSVESPGDLHRWLSGLEIGRAVLGPLARQRGDPCVIHHGLSGFDLRYGEGNSENEPLLTFRREGLGWRLAAVRWGQQ
jgi:hypothetical protein